MAKVRRSTLGVALTVCLVSLVGCDVAPGDGHGTHYVVSNTNCEGGGEHSRNNSTTFYSDTWEWADRNYCLGGVGARLEYKASNGESYYNSWIWHSDSVTSSQVAVSSVASFHKLCSRSTSCTRDLKN